MFVTSLIHHPGIADISLVPVHQHSLHQSLERHRCITQPKGHDSELVESCVGGKCCLLLQGGIHTTLAVSLH